MPQIPAGPASKPWANLNDLISSLMQNSMAQNPVLDDVYSAIDKMRQARETEATGAKQKADDLRAQGIPQTSPMADFTQRAAASISEAFTRKAGQKALAEDLIKQEQQQLVLKNQQDLKALDETYQKTAERAASLGDLETELKMREKIANNNEKLRAGTDIITQLMKNENDKNVANIRGMWDLKVAKERSSGLIGSNPELAQMAVETSPSGIHYIDMSKAPDAQTKKELWTYGKKNNIPTLNDREAGVIGMTRDAFSNIEMMRELVVPELAASPGDVAGRIKRQMQASPKIPFLDIPNPMFGQNPTIASLQALRTSAIQIIQTLAGLGKGLRINQVEIDLARKFDIPDMGDPQGVALGKLKLLEMMTKHVERAAAGLDPYVNQKQEIDEMLKEYAEIKKVGKVQPTKKDAVNFQRQSKAEGLLNELDSLPH